MYHVDGFPDTESLRQAFCNMLQRRRHDGNKKSKVYMLLDDGPNFVRSITMRCSPLKGAAMLGDKSFNYYCPECGRRDTIIEGKCNCC